MQLKTYQQKALAALKNFLERTRETNDPGKSFQEVSGTLDIGRYRSDYRELKDLPGVPYVCVRIPTGGGKTILGAHAVKTAGKSYLERDFPVTLWLVPSNTIRQQTVDALKRPDHPYRRALDDAFEGRVRVFDISEFPNIRPMDMNDAACVIVGTIQTLRVTNTEGRKVYDHHEALEPHFSRFSYLPDKLEKDDKGNIKFSFANLLYLHRPLLIVDEAHNAVTGLTREMQQRINPACVIEFTATPKAMSNVLFSVSASALKDEDMIKLPIVLTAHTSWQAAVSAALAERSRLAEKAEKEPHYIRPVVLFQAQNINQEVNAEVLKKHLIENEQIDQERIAIVTGDQRELDGIYIFDRACPIEYVITVQALKEGWDCSFAYVFCSLANIKSATDVEQLLGRVLRMPYAERRGDEQLNSAYAHVCEPNFIDAAVQMKDKLVEMGFEAEEAEDNLQLPLDLERGDDGPLFSGVSPLSVSFVLDNFTALEALPDDIRQEIKIEKKDDGVVVCVDHPLTEEMEKAVVSLLPKEKQADIGNQLAFIRHYSARVNTPAFRKEPFAVPQLCLFVDGEMELADPDFFLHLGGWNLLDHKAALTSREFNWEERSETFQYDVEREKVVYGHVAQETRQTELEGIDSDWDDKRLARWLNKECRQQDLTHEQLLEFARRVVKDQLDRGVSIGGLVRAKYRLAKALVEKISQYRVQTKEKGYQTSLFQNMIEVETSFDYSFDYRDKPYQHRNYYRGSYQFKNHYFGSSRVGDLKSDGEEFECARALDMQDAVKFWVRNLDDLLDASFRLPKATGWFYPDFVALLKDGRLLVVEYKGGHLQGVEEQQKNSVGQLWEEKSNGKALFLWAEKEKDGMSVYEQIKRKIGA